MKSYYYYSNISLYLSFGRTFLFPNDLELDVEYWAETTDLNEEQLHQVSNQFLHKYLFIVTGFLQILNFKFFKILFFIFFEKFWIIVYNFCI